MKEAHGRFYLFISFIIFFNILNFEIHCHISLVWMNRFYSSIKADYLSPIIVDVVRFDVTLYFSNGIPCFCDCMHDIALIMYCIVFAWFGLYVRCQHVLHHSRHFMAPLDARPLARADGANKKVLK